MNFFNVVSNGAIDIVHILQYHDFLLEYRSKSIAKKVVLAQCLVVFDVVQNRIPSNAGCI